MPRENNLDLLRLLAAISVLLSHAIVIADGNLSADPVSVLTGGQTVLGVVGVFVFFTISGYLVTESFVRTAAPAQYLVKRALRIAPGLIVCVLLTAFVIGPLVTTVPLSIYLRDPQVYAFVANNLVLHVGYNHLPGVTYVGNAVGDIVNGSFWTLPAEVLMYLMVLALGMLRLLTLRVAIALVLAGLLGIIFDTTDHGVLGNFAWLLGYFAMGMCLYLLRPFRPLRSAVAFICALGLILSVPMEHFILIFPICGSYLVIYIAYCRWLPIIRAARFGDLSYGMYIYGWPIEGAVAHFNGNAPWWDILILSFVICLPVAVLSWHVIEKPAIRLKPKPQRSPMSELELRAPAPPLVVESEWSKN